MSKLKKGDLLEHMIYIIEKSFANSSTHIHRKYKIKDSDGVDRELDIYFEVTVNGKLLKYAFECKNHKNAIQLKDIADFQSKIKDKGIKGYFVTTSNYQSGVVKKAKALEIELLKLKSREAEAEDPKGLVIVRKAFKVFKIHLNGHYSEQKPEEGWLTNCQTCSKAVLRMVVEDLLPLLETNIDKGVQVALPIMDDIRKLSTTIGEQNARKLQAVFLYDDSTLTHKGVKVFVNYLRLEFQVWNEIHHQKLTSVDTFSYLRNDNDVFASFSFSEFMIEDQNIIVGVTRAQDNMHKLSISTQQASNEVETHDMVCFGTIDELGLRDILEGPGEEFHGLSDSL